MITLRSNLPNLNLEHQRVLLRVDLNVPIKDGVIMSDHRLRAILPTIDLIQRKGGTVILATHIGRPTGYKHDLSTKHLIPWFEQHGYNITLEPDLDAAYEKSFENGTRILLLENLRFFPGEKKADPSFARQLAALGDYYVNDAFATLHRNDTSLTLTPTLFPPKKRTIGLLIEQELTTLNKLLDNPKRPFVVIIGGGKVQDKIPVLYNLLDKVDTLLLGTAVVFTFLKALDKPVGKSLVDDTALSLCHDILAKAKKHGVKVLFPVDYLSARNTFDGPLEIVTADNFPEHNVGVSIGPETAQLYAQELKQAQTIFYNGLMGTTKRKETLSGAQAIFEAMGESPGLSIIGGGDSVAAAQLLGLADKINYLSTGGGAMLTYLAGEKLPGLVPFS